jgi:DNA-binding response OmpR family regulator
VEDDDPVANSISTGLELEGYLVRRTRTTEDASILLTKSAFDVLLLDIMFPGKSGLQWLLEMRATGARRPNSSAGSAMGSLSSSSFGG